VAKVRSSWCAGEGRSSTKLSGVRKRKRKGRARLREEGDVLEAEPAMGWRSLRRRTTERTAGSKRKVVHLSSFLLKLNKIICTMSSRKLLQIVISFGKDKFLVVYGKSHL
jgi:hypothetical protein